MGTSATFDDKDKEDVPRPYLQQVDNAIFESAQKGSDVVNIDDIPEARGLNALSGVPLEQMRDRVATITLPTRNAMTSGSHNMRKWQIKFDTKANWENPMLQTSRGTNGLELHQSNAKGML